jgi:hypothetical protein
MPTVTEPISAERKEELPNLRYRSELKRAIQLALIRNPRATDLKVCSVLDETEVELPDSWKDGKNRCFLDAYRNSERRYGIYCLISKVRVDLHKLISDPIMPSKYRDFDLMPEEPAVFDSGAGKVNISPKQLRSPGSITAENNVTPENPSASGSEPKASAQEKRPGPLFPRSKLAQTIQELLLKKRDASAREICGLLDEQSRVRLPNEWKNDPNDRSFEDAYGSNKRIRGLIDRRISRVRTRIKAARL